MVKLHRTENLRNRSVSRITYTFPELGSSQQCSDTHQLSTDWGPGDGHRKEVPWKHLLCGCSSLRGWTERSLCYFPNKVSNCETPSIQAFAMFSLPMSPESWALVMQPGDSFTVLLPDGSQVFWGWCHLGSCIQHSRCLPVVACAHVCSAIRNNSQENPVSCALHIVVGAFTLREAPTVTIPARDH